MVRIPTRFSTMGEERSIDLLALGGQEKDDAMPLCGNPEDEKKSAPRKKTPAEIADAARKAATK
eukprot:3143733-Pyramimonas_sp.AAC.1